MPEKVVEKTRMCVYIIIIMKVQYRSIETSGQLFSPSSTAIWSTQQFDKEICKAREVAVSVGKVPLSFRFLWKYQLFDSKDGAIALTTRHAC